MRPGAAPGARTDGRGVATIAFGVRQRTAAVRVCSYLRSGKQGLMVRPHSFTEADGQGQGGHRKLAEPAELNWRVPRSFGRRFYVRTVHGKGPACDLLCTLRSQPVRFSVH